MLVPKDFSTIITNSSCMFKRNTGRTAIIVVGFHRSRVVLRCVRCALRPSFPHPDDHHQGEEECAGEVCGAGAGPRGGRRPSVCSHSVFRFCKSRFLVHIVYFLLFSNYLVIIQLHWHNTYLNLQKYKKIFKLATFFPTFFAHSTVGEAAPRGAAPPWRKCWASTTPALRHTPPRHLPRTPSLLHQHPRSV